jgi:hypothetical protein
MSAPGEADAHPRMLTQLNIAWVAQYALEIK